MCDVIMKNCSNCKRELPANTDYYFKKFDTKDGFTNKCKECSGKSFTNKLTEIPKNNHKFCKNCDRELPSTIQYFPPDKLCKDGLRNVCRECGKDGRFLEAEIHRRVWTDEENEKFIKLYPHYTNEELLEIHYPNETIKTLVDRAYRLGVVKNEETTKRRYVLHSEKMFGIDSPLFDLEKSDETKRKISESRKGKYVGSNSPLYGKKKSETFKLILSLNKKKLGNWKGENNPRHINPLTKDLNGRWKGGISELSVHLRRFIKPWKDESMRACGYKCVITNGEFDNVHHLYNFSYIFEETMRLTDLPIYEQINEYTEHEIELIENTCLQIHFNLGLGVCLRKDIHKLFHDLYGYSNNTPTQFEEFKLRYRLGEFVDLLEQKAVRV